MPSQKSKTKQKYSFEAIGTHWLIETDDELFASLREQIGECAEVFDRTYSRFRDDSVVSKISEKAGEYELGEDSTKLARFYRKLYDATDGVVSPLVGRGLEAGGYDKHYSLSPTHPLPAPPWDDVMSWTDTTIVAREPFVLDIGAAGKGLLVDKLAEILEMADISQYVIDASGDIRHRGKTADRIGLENPFDTSKVIGLAELRNASLCASATNRRAWADGWHHVLDARTGEPTRNVVATWVIASDTMTADGLATALFFVDAGALDGIADFEYVRLFTNGKIEKSKNFVGQLYI